MHHDQHLATSRDPAALPRRRFLLAAGPATFGLAALAGCGAQQGMRAGPEATQDQRPDGRVDLTMVHAAFYGAAGAGEGSLEFRGQRHRFTIRGAGLGGFGVARLEAHGEVYNLRDLQRFPGTYGEARTGVVAGRLSTGHIWLENDAGVVMSLRARQEGLMLSVGADAVVIAFA